MKNCKFCTYSSIHEYQVENHTFSKHLYCFECAHKADNTDSMLDHLKAKHNRDFSCNLCQKRYFEIGKLNTHKKFKHGKGDYKCDICDFKTESKSSFKSHKMIHSEKYVCDITCDHCGVHFNFKRSYEHHIRMVHGTVRYKCDKCAFETKYKKSMEYHQNFHKAKKPMKCDICDERFAKKDNLEAHKKTKHLRLLELKCDICGHKSLNKHRLKAHMLTHEAKTLKCEECDFATQYKGSLERHIELEHTNTKTEKCTICEYNAKSVIDYRNHMFNNHSGLQKCEHCDYETIDRKALVRHLKNCNSKALLYSCHKCDFKTSSYSYLGPHVSKVHGKNTKCDHCSYTNEDIKSMRRHEKRCLQKKEFALKCDFCDFFTFSHKTMTKHRKTCNADSMMVKCTKCEYKSSSQFIVTKHIVKMHGRYSKCSFCIYSNEDFGSLRKHEVQFCTGEKEMHKCEHCAGTFSLWQLQRHRKNCQENIEATKKDLRCKICGYVSFSNLSHNAHQNVMHQDIDEGMWVVKLMRV